MSLRMGVTRTGRAIMEKMVSEGASWAEVYKKLSETDDIDGKFVKETIYDKLVAKLAKKSPKGPKVDDLLGGKKE